jgi:hypothetical protein
MLEETRWIDDCLNELDYNSSKTISQKRIPFLLGEVVSNTILEVRINNQIHLRKNFTPPKDNKVIIYQFMNYPHEYGYKNIEIKIIEGSLVINATDACGLYPGFYQKGFHNRLKYQINYIDWFYSDTHHLGVKYFANSIIKFKHLFKNGPSFVDTKVGDCYLYCPLFSFEGDRNSITQKLLQSDC